MKRVEFDVKVVVKWVGGPLQSYLEKKLLASSNCLQLLDC